MPLPAESVLVGTKTGDIAREHPSRTSTAFAAIGFPIRFAVDVVGNAGFYEKLNAEERAIRRVMQGNDTSGETVSIIDQAKSLYAKVLDRLGPGHLRTIECKHLLAQVAEFAQDFEFAAQTYKGLVDQSKDSLYHSHYERARWGAKAICFYSMLDKNKEVTQLLPAFFDDARKALRARNLSQKETVQIALSLQKVDSVCESTSNVSGLNACEDLFRERVFDNIKLEAHLEQHLALSDYLQELGKRLSENRTPAKLIFSKNE